MVERKIKAVYFSPTGTTEKIVVSLAEGLACGLGAPCECNDFTLPKARENALKFVDTDIVVFGTPVYAGRVPNVLLNFLALIEGNGACAIPVVVFGNRDYDDALIELRDILERAGLRTIAAAAFVGEHSFSTVLAKDRPDEEDIMRVRAFVDQVIEKYTCSNLIEWSEPIDVKGISFPYRGYYMPRDREGNPVDIRKVKPLVNEHCNECKLCVRVCPMGSLAFDNVREYRGICIKYGACLKKCPQKARYYQDAGYLYHCRELEEGFARRAEPELFV